MHDLVIRGGTVHDGTGAEARTADVAIDAGVVTEVGRVDGEARRTLDADGLLVTPGFVDVHVHYDGQATWDTQLLPSAWHGVTTVVAGNCGVGFAPVRPADHQRLIELMEGVEDIPGTALHEGLPWTWQTFGEFLDALEVHPYDVDLATQVPHSALRLHVMGERGAQREAATPEDIEAMARLAGEGIRAGALGFSTSRTMNHRTSKGELTPTLTAAADELLGIAAAVGATGTGVLQVVSDFVDVDAEFGLFRSMAETSGRPLAFSLADAHGRNWERLLELLEEANGSGVTMRGQAAARAIGLLLGLQCSLSPFLGNPVMKEVLHLSPAEQARTMADPAFKARVLESGHAGLAMWDRMYELGDPPDYEPDPSTSIEARAAAKRRDPIELVYDLMAQDDGRTLLYVPIINWFDGNLDAVGAMLAHEHTIPGLSDGGAHVGTICDASFPTTFLSYWGRDRAEGRLPVPFLVRRHTRDTARSVGLLDRGVLAPGYRGDCNLIDFEALQPRRPEVHYDLPAGGRRLLQRADGYVATVVAGEVTYEGGEHTGALPGRLVRGAQPAPRERRDPPTMTARSDAFLALHHGEGPLLMPNAWDLGSARILAHLGFAALATTSSGFAATLGRLDGGVTRQELLDHCTAMAAATDLPLNGDLEDGFGDTPAEVAETMRLCVEAGLAGASVEDYTRDRAHPIFDLDQAAERVAAAVEGARAAGGMVVVARAENLIKGVADLPDTIRRLQRYQEAGADVLFAPGLATAEDIRAVVSSVDRPLNVLVRATSPSVAELAELGVARISVGGSLAWVALDAMATAARELKEQGTYGGLARVPDGVALARAALPPG